MKTIAMLKSVNGRSRLIGTLCMLAERSNVVLYTDTVVSYKLLVRFGKDHVSEGKCGFASGGRCAMTPSLPICP